MHEAADAGAVVGSPETTDQEALTLEEQLQIEVEAWDALVEEWETYHRGRFVATMPNEVISTYTDSLKELITILNEIKPEVARIFHIPDEGNIKVIGDWHPDGTVSIA